MTHKNSSFGHFLDGMEDDPRVKREKLLMKFSGDFQRDYYRHSMSKTVFELLIRDKNEYEIIELLLKQNIDMFRIFETAVECLPNNNLLNDRLKQKGLI